MSETTYIGTQFAKPLQNDRIPDPNNPEKTIENPAPNTLAKLKIAADWCNRDGLSYIEDKGDFYEVVENPKQPEPTEEEIAIATLAKAKRARADAVSKLTVTVDGMVFDADETSQNRMSRVVAGAQALGIDQSTTQVWVLADNTVATPTVAQLAQALKLAGEKQSELWIVPYQTEKETETNTDGE